MTSHPLSVEAARYRLRVSTSDDLVDSALAALTAGADSGSLAVLAGESRPTMAECGPLFELALKDLSIPLPTRDQAVWDLLRYHIASIATGAVSPQPGMLLVLNEVYFPANLYAETQKIVGDSHGLSDMLGYFYGLDDIADRPDEVSCDGEYGSAAVHAVEHQLVRLATEWILARDQSAIVPECTHG